MNLQERDRNVIWHPFTQHQTAALPIPIVRGQGAYLFDELNKSYLDLTSSWWVNLHGHAQPDIAKSIYEQALRLEHVIFAGFTHQPAIQLAEEILTLLPAQFTKLFYSDNGSTAVEVALKMAYQYWRNQGENHRTRFLSFNNNYHGDTFGAMAVGQGSHYFNQFTDLVFSVDLFEFPESWDDDDLVIEKEKQTLSAIGKYLAEFGQQTAAIILEPLVQGACGMRMCRPEFLRALQDLIRSHHVLIIYDEVMTGFGRTGKHFACLTAGTVPDIVCLAKGITGGFLPLAATVCHEKLFKAFQDDSFEKALAHGHSYTANPLGCAAGLASLNLLSKTNLNQITDWHTQHLKKLSRNLFKKVRQCGTIAAFELALPIAYGSKQSWQLQQRFLQRGLLIRPLGNVIYLMPPYCVQQRELDYAYQIICEEVEALHYEFS